LIIKSIAIIFSLTLIAACADKKDLITGEWVMDWYFLNGEGQDQPTTLKWTFMDDGSFRQLIENSNGREELKGNWTLDEDSDLLVMYYTSTRTEVLWSIVKLERGFMEVNHTIPGFFVERGFKKQP
jgi:hypothetical protein